MLDRRASRWLGRAVGTVLALLALVSCGGGGGGSGTEPPPDPGVAGAPYFPLAAGDRWRMSEGSSVSVSRVMDTQTIDGALTYRVHTDDASGSYDSYYAKTDSGVSYVPGPNEDAFTRAIGRYDMLRFPLRVGTSYVAVEKNLAGQFDFDGDRKADNVTVRVEVQVVGFESLVTPAGTFSNVLHTRSVYTETIVYSSDNASATYVATSDTWYAPQIGPVRFVSTTVGPGVNDRSESMIAGYRVGALSSDSVAPTVASYTPAAGSLGQIATISATFSEMLDRTTVAANAISVTGPGGAAVAGSFSWSGDITLTFAPNATLGTGTYAVTVAAGAQDLLGNAMASPVTWQFGIDRSGPGLLSVAPADSTVDVATSATVTITYDEPLAAATVNATNFWLETGGVPVPATLTLSGTVVNLKPSQALAKGTKYTLHIGTGVTDLSGNSPTQNATFGFTTDPGRFALPQTLAALAEFPVALLQAADLDGDGRGELIAVQQTQVLSGRIAVVSRAADGTPAPTAKVLPTGGCLPDSMAVADFDGNGLQDVVTSAFFCGLEWTAQTAPGVWAYRGRLATQATDVTSVALANATRPGVAAIVNDGTIRLWRPSATGSGFAAPEDIPSGATNLRGLTSGDLNGDGRTDLVAVGTAGLNPAILLFLQRADGGFDVQTIESLTALTVLAVADIDGDNRADLLVSEWLPNTSLLVMKQTPAGTLAEPVRVTLPKSPWSVRVVDFTGDGRADILVNLGGTGPVLATQQSDGSFTVSTLLGYSVPDTFANGIGFVVSDFSGDGLADILMGNQLLRQRAGATGGLAATSAPLGAAAKPARTARSPWARRPAPLPR